MKFVAVIVAGGTGQRAGAGTAKQWRTLAGKPVLRWSVEAFARAGAADIVVVAPAGQEDQLGQALAGLSGWRTTTGGATRALSVQAGLAALADADEAVVMVHDAARPLLAARHIASLLVALEGADGALPALAVADTLKRETDGVLRTTPRDGLWRAQTPQAFRLPTLRAAYAAWSAGDGEPTDDAAVVERAGGRVVKIEGDIRLMKLTYPEDFEMAEHLAAPTLATRIGQGFDAHRFGPGESVMLCGVEIAHDHGLIGHSDADVGLHALTDALLGAAGAGDIGDHFPPTDPQWRGVDSGVFLRHAGKLIAEGGGMIVNVDVTLICERPKIKPHREAMRARIAELLDLAIARVSVKATTTEQMGFTGRQEGLAAQAVASVQYPA